VDQLEQFRSGLLFGGIDVLVAVDDIDIDGQVAGMLRDGLIARRNLRIALRAAICG